MKRRKLLTAATGTGPRRRPGPGRRRCRRWLKILATPVVKSTEGAQTLKVERILTKLDVYLKQCHIIERDKKKSTSQVIFVQTNITNVQKKGSNRLAAGDLQIYGILCQDSAAEISIFVKNGKGPWFCVNIPIS